MSRGVRHRQLCFPGACSSALADGDGRRRTRAEPVSRNAGDSLATTFADGAPYVSAVRHIETCSAGAAVVEQGDLVFAYGSLFETETPSNALLCSSAGGWAPDVGCIGMSRTIAVVAVSNVNVRDLPGTEAEPNDPDLPKRTWVTFHVRVEGEWANGTLESARIEPADPPSLRRLFPMPEPPCDAPAGGWPGDGGDS